MHGPCRPQLHATVVSPATKRGHVGRGGASPRTQTNTRMRTAADFYRAVTNNLTGMCREWVYAVAGHATFGETYSHM